jgi:hypothetical protein
MNAAALGQFQVARDIEKRGKTGVAFGPIRNGGRCRADATRWRSKR